MPIYEYECPKCGSFEVLQKISEEPLKAKPDCSEKKCPCKAQRIISASAFHLKGAGWYKTDYTGSSSPQAPNKPVKSSDSDTKSSGDTTSSSGGAEKGDTGKSGTDGGSSSSGGETKKKAGSCGPGCGCH